MSATEQYSENQDSFCRVRVITKSLRNKHLVEGKRNPKTEVPLLKEQMTRESTRNKSQDKDLLQVVAYEVVPEAQPKREGSGGEGKTASECMIEWVLTVSTWH